MAKITTTVCDKCGDTATGQYTVRGPGGANERWDLCEKHGQVLMAYATTNRTYGPKGRKVVSIDPDTGEPLPQQ